MSSLLIVSPFQRLAQVQRADLVQQVVGRGGGVVHLHAERAAVDLRAHLAGLERVAHLRQHARPEVVGLGHLRRRGERVVDAGAGAVGRELEVEQVVVEHLDDQVVAARAKLNPLGLAGLAQIERQIIDVDRLGVAGVVA